MSQIRNLGLFHIILEYSLGLEPNVTFKTNLTQIGAKPDTPVFKYADGNFIDLSITEKHFQSLWITYISFKTLYFGFFQYLQSFDSTTFSCDEIFKRH